jgi:outer membrane protein OmpA-like peptidoglycan-associated protein
MAPTKEDIRKAAIEAVAKRIADQQARNLPPLPPPAPPAPTFKPKPAKQIDVAASSGGRIIVSPTAVLTFGQHQEDLVFTSPTCSLPFQPLVAGDANEGQVEFKVPVSWKFPPIQERSGEAAMALEGQGLAQYIVPFTINTDKPEQPSVVWQNATPVELTSDGGGATFAVPSPPVVTNTTADGGTANFSPFFQFQVQVALADTTAGDTISVSEGFSIAIVSANVQGTHDTGGGHQEQLQASLTKLKTFSFTAKVALTKPKAPDPLPKAPPLVVLFDVDSDKTTSDEGPIREWYKGLDKRLRNSIETGRTPINLLGKASATGSEEHNRQLAHRRANKVKDILQDRAGDQARIFIQVIGNADAKSKVEDQIERVVEVTVGDDRPVTD